MGKGTQRLRGGFTRAATSRRRAIETVGIPSDSMHPWIRPTAWLHIGQTGVRRAQSAPSSLSFLAASGAVSLRSLPGAVIDPMKLR